MTDVARQVEQLQLERTWLETDMTKVMINITITHNNRNNGKKLGTKLVRETGDTAEDGARW